MLSRMSRASCRRDSWPALYDARAKWKAELPSMSVLSRSKKAALRCGSAAIHFDDDRVALATARADRRDTQAAAAAPKRVPERAEDATAGRADRMTERDRPTVHVHLRLVDAEHSHGIERDRGERLVDLEEVDVVHRQPGLLERRLGRIRGRARGVGEVIGHRGLRDDRG